LVFGRRVFDVPDVFVMATSYRNHCQLLPTRPKFEVNTFLART
jgi:hypothetical protein